MSTEQEPERGWVWSDQELKAKWDIIFNDVVQKDVDFRSYTKLAEKIRKFVIQLEQELIGLKKSKPTLYPHGRRIDDYEFYHIITGSTPKRDDPPTLTDFPDQQIRKFIEQKYQESLEN